LTESDWDRRLGGWKCDTLSIPGAKLAELYHSGRDANRRFYQVQGTSVIWTGANRPREVVATVILEKDLSKIEEERLRLEQVRSDLESEKLALEKEKFDSERRWKIYSAAGAVLSAMLAAATTFNLIPQIHSSNQVVDIGLLEYFSHSNDFLATGITNRYEPMLKAARREVWFVGTSFYISVGQYTDELASKLTEGVNLNFLILDPESSALASTAKMFATSEDEVRNQCQSGLSSLLKLIEEANRSAVSTAGQITVKLSSEPLTSRMYFFDPKSDDGVSFYVPQVNRMNSQELPGFLVKNKSAKFHEKYFDGVRKLWFSGSVALLQDWIAAHPGTVRPKP
jgi:hypothetical protein